jgi:lipopolysaccharide transport system ATP-binding protein
MLNPDVLLIDEVLAVGDANFRAKCLDRIGKIIKDTAVVFVSHNIPQIQRVCNRVLYLENASVAFHGNVMMGLSKYIASTKQVNEPLLIKNESIKSFECRLGKNVINYDEDLLLSIQFETSEFTKTSLCLCSIADRTGELCAQTDFSEALPTIPRGKYEHIIVIKNIHLSEDTYTLNISVFTENNKQTVVHARHCAQFKVVGQLGFGPKYQLMAKKLQSPSVQSVNASHG